MTKKKFDMEAIGFINLFEKITKVNVKDCIFDKDIIYFLVENGKAGKAIGKNGNKIKKLRRKLKKNIKVFEYDEDSKEFVKKLIPKNKSLEVKNKKISISVDPKEKGKIIGRNGKNINKIRELLKRNSDVKKLEIK